MQKPQKTIGILGGTFDPIHYGHIELAKCILSNLPLTEIRFIPCYQPVHRTPPIANPSQRLTMLKLALEDEPNLIVDDREIKRQGPSYMVDTLKSLRRDFPDTALCLIMGEDAFAGLPTWKEWQSLLKLAHLIVINRPDTPAPISPDLQNLLKTAKIEHSQALRDHFAGAIYPFQIAPIPLSATQIRQALHNKNTPLNSIPPNVYDYILTHNIY